MMKKTGKGDSHVTGPVVDLGKKDDKETKKESEKDLTTKIKKSK